MAAEGLKDSEWGAVFGEVSRNCRCIVVVRLSLDYDLDIKRFIFNKNVINKTVFIESPKITLDKKRKLERLGCVRSIGMKTFVQELWEYASKHTIRIDDGLHYYYKAFEAFRTEEIQLKASTTFEVHDLFYDWSD